MRLYHYATWLGEKINRERVIIPGKKYSNWVAQTIIDEWPALTFLTQNPEWEPSVQTKSKEGYWERCGSLPETNEAMGIPSWKFEINPNGLILGMPTDFRGCSKWEEMIEDARQMGSNIEDWRIAVQDAYVINAWKWENDEWFIRPTG
jgi:hypothetical protein